MKYIARFIRLMVGLFIFAAGLVMIMKSDLGYGPWELFHDGLTNIVPITIGQATVIVGAIIVIANFLLKEAVGIGTLFNMVFMGVFIDLILFLNVIPVAGGLFGGIMLILLGFFISAVGTWLYLSSAFGAGPRDGLMVALRRKTGIPVGISRCIIECAAALAGWLLGGPLGVGTVASIVGFGLFIQLVFRIVKFEATAVEHENLNETIKTIREMIKGNR